ncbi:MAG: hypothetical protein MI923_22085, partial [Phycisphaerales bacterium]|nr:hypothetical protein [Phycisphaerales bacterium]
MKRANGYGTLNKRLPVMPSDLPGGTADCLNLIRPCSQETPCPAATVLLPKSVVERAHPVRSCARVWAK